MRIIALILLFFASSAWAADTLFGSDDDNNGVIDIIKQVGQPDRDADGELSVADGGYDCDDTNPRIKNNSYVRVDATNYKKCVNGSYTANTTAQLCERGTCYYVNPATGSDANPCTWASPCATFSKLTVGGSIAMAGDTAIYLMGATDLTTPVVRTPDGGDECPNVGIETEAAGTSSSSKNILAKYPTATAKINLNCPARASCCQAIKIAHNNWTVRDLEITGNYGGGIDVTAGTNDEIDNLWIHDVKCFAGNNCSCVKVQNGSNNIDLHHGILTNCYDPALTLLADDRQNVAIVNFYGNSQNQVARYVRHGFSTPVRTSPFENAGGGIRWKHGNTPGDMSAINEAYGNIGYNEDYGYNAQGAKTRIHGNLCLNCLNFGGARDWGGGDGYFFDEIYVENNSAQIVGGDNPHAAMAFLNAPSSVTTIANRVRNNVIVDSQASYSGGETTMFKLFQYGSDALYTALVTNSLLSVSGNCWHNAAVGAGLANGFGVFSDNGSTSSGALVNFANFKLAPYNFDASPLGYNENPLFTSDYRATSTNCTGKGWQAEWPAITPTAAPTTNLPSVFLR